MVCQRRLVSQLANDVSFLYIDLESPSISNMHYHVLDVHFGIPGVDILSSQQTIIFINGLIMATNECYLAF